MLKWIVLTSLTVLLSFAVYLYRHLGWSQPVEITIREAGPFLMLYKEHRGPYHQIGAVISEVEKWALEKNLPCSKTFGEYLDDPESADEDRLRSRGGCLTQLPADFKLPENYAIREVPLKKYVLARFQGSPAISPYTVYPKVKTYVFDNRIKIAPGALEIYTVDGQKVTTEYLFEIL